jgi:hypothetical protein
MEKNVQLKYRMYRRRNGVFYWQDNGSQKQGTLRTTDKREAEKLLNAMNESHRQPTLNLNLARAYLATRAPNLWRDLFGLEVKQPLPRLCVLRNLDKKQSETRQRKKVYVRETESLSKAGFAEMHFPPDIKLTALRLARITHYVSVMVVGDSPKDFVGQNDDGKNCGVNMRSPKTLRQIASSKREVERRRYGLRPFVVNVGIRRDYISALLRLIGTDTDQIFSDKITGWVKGFVSPCPPSYRRETVYNSINTTLARAMGERTTSGFDQHVECFWPQSFPPAHD